MKLAKTLIAKAIITILLIPFCLVLLIGYLAGQLTVSIVSVSEWIMLRYKDLIINLSKWSER